MVARIRRWVETRFNVRFVSMGAECSNTELVCEALGLVVILAILGTVIASCF